MRILITGAAGFIGSHVADASLEDGHEVLVLDDLSTGDRENVPSRATFVEVDLRDRDRLMRIMGDYRPDLVNHQAAQTSVAVSTREPVRDAEINIIGSLNLLDACIKHGVQRLVYASTGGAVYGEVPEGKRAGVDWIPSPLSPYACSKLAVENYIRTYHSEYGIKYNILRYANVYGPRQCPHGEAGVIAIFCDRLLNGQKLQINARREPGDPGCIRDYVFVGDVVGANLLALKNGISSAIINVGTGIASTTLDVVTILKGLMGVEEEIIYAPRRAGDLERSVLEPEQEKLLGPAVPLEMGLKKTIEWYRTSQH